MEKASFLPFSVLSLRPERRTTQFDVFYEHLNYICASKFSNEKTTWALHVAHTAKFLSRLRGNSIKILESQRKVSQLFSARFFALETNEARRRNNGSFSGEECNKSFPLLQWNASSKVKRDFTSASLDSFPSTPIESLPTSPLCSTFAIFASFFLCSSSIFLWIENPWRRKRESLFSCNKCKTKRRKTR